MEGKVLFRLPRLDPRLDRQTSTYGALTKTFNNNNNNNRPKLVMQLKIKVVRLKHHNCIKMWKIHNLRNYGIKL